MKEKRRNNFHSNNKWKSQNKINTKRNDQENIEIEINENNDQHNITENQNNNSTKEINDQEEENIESQTRKRKFERSTNENNNPLQEIIDQEENIEHKTRKRRIERSTDENISHGSSSTNTEIETKENNDQETITEKQSLNEVIKVNSSKDINLSKEKYINNKNDNYHQKEIMKQMKNIKNNNNNNVNNNNIIYNYDNQVHNNNDNDYNDYNNNVIKIGEGDISSHAIIRGKVGNISNKHLMCIIVLIVLIFAGLKLKKIVKDNSNNQNDLYLESLPQQVIYQPEILDSNIEVSHEEKQEEKNKDNDNTLLIKPSSPIIQPIHKDSFLLCYHYEYLTTTFPTYSISLSPRSSSPLLLSENQTYQHQNENNNTNNQTHYLQLILTISSTHQNYTICPQLISEKEMKRIREELEMKIITKDESIYQNHSYQINQNQNQNEESKEVIVDAEEITNTNTNTTNTPQKEDISQHINETNNNNQINHLQLILTISSTQQNSSNQTIFSQLISEKEKQEKELEMKIITEDESNSQNITNYDQNHSNQININQQQQLDYHHNQYNSRNIVCNYINSHSNRNNFVFNYLSQPFISSIQSECQLNNNNNISNIDNTDNINQLDYSLEQKLFEIQGDIIHQYNEILFIVISMTIMLIFIVPLLTRKHVMS